MILDDSLTEILLWDVLYQKVHLEPLLDHLLATVQDLNRC
jgi:hypothetical protein